MSFTSRTLRPAVMIAVLLTVAACAAPRGLKELYVPLATGAGYGYTEQAIGDRRFQITYDSPIDTAFTFGPEKRNQNLGRAFDFALLHAADVAIANGAPAFRVVDRVNDVEVRNYPYYRDPFWSPGWGWHRPYYRYPWMYDPYFDDSYATLSSRVTLMIELLPAPEQGAYDAHNVQTTIRARYAVPEA